jgi:hypothetical protein
MTEFDTKWTTFPVCPHCGKADQDWWDGLSHKWDGDSWEVNCGFCMKEYQVTISVDTTFDTKKIKEDENHDD